MLLFSQNTWKKKAENINYSFFFTNVHPFECTDVSTLVQEKKISNLCAQTYNSKIFLTLFTKRLPVQILTKEFILGCLENV